MFQKEELERLRKQKALLVLQSEANRQKLAEDWQRLFSADYWASEARGMVRRHPAVATALAAGGGILAARLLRKPGGIAGALGGVGRLTSVAFTVWRLFRRQKEQPKED